VSGPWVPDWKPEKDKKPKVPPKPRDWSKRQDGQTPIPTERARNYIERIRAKLRGQKPQGAEHVADVPESEIPF